MRHLVIATTVGLLLLAQSSTAQRLPPPDHSTCATAKVIDAPSHFEGVDAEYAWMREHYPHHEKVGQRLLSCPQGPADEVVLADASGQETRIVFDLSKVWGKGLDLPE